MTNGGAPVTGYRVEWTSDGVTLGDESATGLNHEIEGLTNGVDYEVRVAAVNVAGAGPWSDEDEGSPVGTPDAPQALSAERGDRSAVIEWSPPTDDGSSVITGYKIQWRSGGQVFNASRQSRVGSGVSEYEVTGLVNGAGDSGERGRQWRSFAGSVPNPGDCSGRARRAGHCPWRPILTVSWGAPGDGGSVITTYRVQWRADNGDFEDSDTQASVGGGALSHRITGLVNGTEYFVRVMAVNGVGEGPWSSSASSTPAVLPGPPRSVAVKPANGSIAVTWQAPASTGGSPITGYKVQWRAGSQGYDTSRQAAVTDLEDLGHRPRQRDEVSHTGARGQRGRQRCRAAGASSYRSHQSGIAQQCCRGEGRQVRDSKLEGGRRQWLVHHRLHGAVALRGRRVRGQGSAGHSRWRGSEPQDYGSRQWHRILGSGTSDQQRG